MKLRSLLSLAAVTSAVILTGCAAPQSSTPAAPAAAAPAMKWTCTAPGLVTARYTGGSTAYVHLSRYTSGGSYPVVKNASGNVATGKTADGTDFVCKTEPK